MTQNNAEEFVYDLPLLIIALTILGIGLIMLASASIAVADNQTGQPFYYFTRQAVFASVGVFLGYILLRVPTEFWQSMRRPLLLFSILLLCAVLIPGIGYEVNGSMRWIKVGSVAFQVSELAKLTVIIFLAGYLAQYYETVMGKVAGFLRAMLVILLVSGLLLLEPDFGAAVVVLATTLMVLFLAGASLKHFITIVLLSGAGLYALIATAPYRWQRVTAFLNPWADQYNSGYQLTQALIAFGRGEFWGEGLGRSIQKLFYLPEAHTDFVFAVLAEELGLIGALSVLLLYALLTYRGFVIARTAYLQQRAFQAYLAYGMSLWLGLQSLISIGVNTGALPTKGLTLPLMSYGGSSLLVSLVAIALLLRISHENKIH